MNGKREIKERVQETMEFIRCPNGYFLGQIKLDEAMQNGFMKELASIVFKQLESHFDNQYGGFATLPKFPHTMVLKYLLDYAGIFKDEKATAHVNLSLEKMIKGGIYDQLGGGFFSYSKDSNWRIPHFEKTLYNNALLISLLSHAYRSTKKELYQNTIHEILDWVNREMTDDEGGFYTALKADSEGTAGAFYTWGKKEIFALLGDDAYIFNAYYDIVEQGNWKGKNIPRRRISISSLAMSIGWEDLELERIMEKWKIRLFLKRENRLRPSLDDRILLDWNASMCTAYCHAYQATGKERYRKIAEKNISFIYAKMKKGTGFYHSYKNGKTEQDATLNDYVFLIEALIELHKTTLAKCYLHEAKRIMDETITDFYEKESGYFYLNPKDQRDVSVEKTEIYNHVTALGNSKMLYNLRELGIFFVEDVYKTMAGDLLLSLQKRSGKRTEIFPEWVTASLHNAFEDS